ncbi:cytochrome P450 [Mycena leptocephala]|nr:cytochrome P450 [Mycena leptocephala]
MLLKLLGSIAGSLGAYGLYEILKLVYSELTSPTRYLPGPKSTHWFYGNIREIFKAENSVMHEQWVQQYGPTIKYKAFQMNRLYTVDTSALNHFLTNSNIYQKPESARYNLARMLGRGILVSEGEEHRQQRKVMRLEHQIRELTEIFVAKSAELRDIWSTQVANAGGTARIDVLSWLSKATLDIIGLAGFNYEFNNLSSDGTSELGAAFSTIFRTGMKIDLIRILQTWVAALRFIPTKLDATMATSRATMMRIGRKLLQDSKNEMAENGHSRRDALGISFRYCQRLSDEDVLAQVPTFLVAGHETTSTATTWALFALTQNMAAQNRLREELLAVSTDNPTMDQLNELPYLDCVVRETLRVHAPVPAHRDAGRRGNRSRPRSQISTAPYMRLSSEQSSIYIAVAKDTRVNKGQTIMIPILAMNRDKAIWGPDAMEFIPERWESRSTSNSIPGVWGHMLTFLGGPRACIGYRFSLVEMKALLFTLVRAFEFELAVPASDIEKKSGVVQRPILRSEPERETRCRSLSSHIFIPTRYLVRARANAGGTARIDVLSWLSKATLDIIGLAGFNYEFNNLSSDGTSELGAAFSTIFRTGMKIDLIHTPNLGCSSPLHPTKLDATMATPEPHDENWPKAPAGQQERNGRKRDIRGTLSGSPFVTDVLAQVPTFLVAGHETTSTATTWALFALTQNMAAQNRLREELLTVSTDNPTMDQLNELPYLDCVVRETLRVHAPVPSTMRIADAGRRGTARDPVHGYLRHRTRDSKVNKGQIIMIPILAMNRDKAIWGPDAMEFIPERWESRSTSNSIPGVWGHMLTFLGGPRACIGYRFSLVEMKALLFTLVRAFEFELAVPASDIEKKSGVVPRPILRSEREAGNQMPLIIKPYIHS